VGCWSDRDIRSISYSCFAFTVASSPPRPSGPQLDLSVDSVVRWLRSQQLDASKLNSRPFHYPKEGPGSFQKDGLVELCARDNTVAFIASMMKSRKDCFVNSVFDQKAFSIPVCSGLSGLGKTRLLDEWPTYFARAGIDGAHLGVLVMYANGHALTGADEVLSVEAAFAWRLLHRVFLEDNGAEFATFFKKRTLPANANDLALEDALHVLYAGALATKAVAEGQLLSLFVGIDEYQVLSDGDLEKLVSCLQNCKQLDNIRVYPLFAGTDWSKISIANSSKPDTKRVPLPLLLPRDAEHAIESVPEWKQRLVDEEFRRRVFYLGGMPRAVVELARSGDYDDVWTTRVQNNWNMDDKSLIKLVAWAMSGLPVKKADCPELKIWAKEKAAEGYYTTSYTWQRLADMGVCLLNELGEGEEKQLYVQVPYCVLKLASVVGKGFQGAKPEQCLLQNLHILSQHVDHRTFVTEPWQLWEVFGACFHALRINALQILGHSNCHFTWICDGAMINGCDYEVELKPVEVRATTEQLSADTGDTVNERDTNTPLPWLRGRDGIWFVLINGADGPAVDLFFCLPLANVDGVLFCGDQRKFTSANLGEQRAEDLLNAVRRQVPRCLPGGSRVVTALFSLFPSFNSEEDGLPEDSFVVSFAEHSFYHGSLAFHPASSPCIDVNRCGITKLQLLSSISARAREIMDNRPFQALGAFKDFVGDDLSAEDAERVIVYA
jgi:hypothetical protein